MLRLWSMECGRGGGAGGEVGVDCLWLCTRIEDDPGK